MTVHLINPYFNGDLEVYCLVGIKLNDGETDCILKMKKTFLKIWTV